MNVKRLLPLIPLVFLSGCLSESASKGLGQVVLIVMLIVIFIVLFLIVGTLIALIIGIRNWKKTKEKKWLLLPLVPIIIILIISGLSNL